MAKKNSNPYVLIGPPYLSGMFDKNRDYSIKSIKPTTTYISLDIKHLVQVTFTSSSSLTAANLHVYTRDILNLSGSSNESEKVYVAGILGYSKISTDESIIEEVRNDYRKILKLISGEDTKPLNLSDFDLVPTDEEDNSEE